MYLETADQRADTLGEFAEDLADGETARPHYGWTMIAGRWLVRLIPQPVTLAALVTSTGIVEYFAGGYGCTADGLPLPPLLTDIVCRRYAQALSPGADRRAW